MEYLPLIVGLSIGNFLVQFIFTKKRYYAGAFEISIYQALAIGLVLLFRQYL